MRAVILAAGVGKRLGEFTQNHPKCLLEFGGQTLLSRHIAELNRLGMEHISIVVGHLASQVEQEVQRAASQVPIALVPNERYSQGGSGLSLLAASSSLRQGPALVMDADLLYAPEVLDRLSTAPNENCLLVDGALQDTGEEVKAVVREGRVCELGKRVSDQHHVAGESVGIFKFGRVAGARFADLLAIHTERDPWVEYEPVLNELLAEVDMGCASVDGVAWIEIDFWDDVERARATILPRLSPRS